MKKIVVYVTSIAVSSALALAVLTAPSTQAQTSQLDNNPNLEGLQTAQQAAATADNGINPLWWIIPLVLLVAAGGWLLWSRTQPTHRGHKYNQYPFNVAGAKGGETQATRNDNDVYAESLNSQEARLRQFYDNEPTPEK